ncbi:MAG: M20/M25/M40 family metallo-hydrolase [Bacteroidota bacterium]
MKIKLIATLAIAVFVSSYSPAQKVLAQEDIINQIIAEANDSSQLEALAHELFDVIGPRLVGSPQMKKAHEWAVNKYAQWGIPARNEQWGEWLGWERGISHIDMISPRVKTLNGMQLAFSPPTTKKGTTAELIIFSGIKDSLDFRNWLPKVNGKFVLFAPHLANGRPTENLEKWAKNEESLLRMKSEREQSKKDFQTDLKNTGLSKKLAALAMEEAGAVGIIESNWSDYSGANKIFRSHTKQIPTIDISLEDYGMLYRMALNNDNPQIKVVTESKFLGAVPAFNTIAEIKGTELPDEYVILSAHFDSWDGGSGATDNGTGTILMMETARILKKLYPNPKRTILIGHWGAEEQGLHGSKAFVEDHPEVIEGAQVVFNQDNGTGRVFRMNGQGFLNAYDFLEEWLTNVPGENKNEIEREYPGLPGRGGSDHSSFVAKGVPVFNLFGKQWDYGTYTWHTNLDTYDKIVFEDVRNNVVIAAILAYMASEDPEKASREQRLLPMNKKTGERTTWPEPKSPNRRGYLDEY